MKESKPSKRGKWSLKLLLGIPLLLTLWAMTTELFTLSLKSVDDPARRALSAADAAVPAQDDDYYSRATGDFDSSVLYPDDVFETDWRQQIEPGEILHLNALHRGCVTQGDRIIPWTFGRSGQNESDNLNELIDRDDPQLLEKLRACPDVDILLPVGLRSFGYCEDGAAYTKFLKSRMLPRWAFEVKLEDAASNRSVTYHELCPETPLVLFNHYWEGVVDEPDWPADKPLYLMPNIEMYELESEHYWRSDVVLCKTALCARYLRQWLKQEGNPRGTRVVYTRHTTSNLALEVQRDVASSDVGAVKDFANVSFLHTAGKSIQKGTRQVLNCWLSRPDLPLLDFYMDEDLYRGAFKDYDKRIRSSTNIHVHTGRWGPGEFGRVIAEGRYFLCPSLMEGYGHYINQARSSNAFVFTTDAAPMNELITRSSGALIQARVSAHGEQFLGGLSPKAHALRKVPGLVADFSGDALCDAVVDVLKSTSPEEREKEARRALQQYYFDTVFFATKMQGLRQSARSRHGTSHANLRMQDD